MNAPRLVLLRFLAATLLLVAMTGCTGGINAGEKGGQAFIGLTIMLLVSLGILWAVLGREK